MFKVPTFTKLDAFQMDQNNRGAKPIANLENVRLGLYQKLRRLHPIRKNGIFIFFFTV
jgi:hypothetical protein